MSKDFIDALNQLAIERNLDKMELINNFEQALEQAYERNVEPGKEIDVIIDPNSGELEVLVIRKVVEEVLDPDKEISLEEALELDPDIEVEMELEFPVDPERFTRIALQTTKQVITQKIREAERQMILDEYIDRKGEVVTATVSRNDNKRNVFVDLGRGEALMPVREQIPGERYMIGMRLKVFIKEVESSNRGPSIIVSRSAAELLEYLMRQEIPEIADSTVILKSVSREAGQRSKVAVTSTNPNVDPIGACIGQRGSRIQAVTAELQRERVDVILWDPNPAEFIRNALSPAKVGKITIDDDAKEATISVPSDQLSLAIGKSGQNVRLAAKLTGYKLDLKPTEGISDLDAAMLQAASSDSIGDSTVSGSKQAAFDALFSDTKEAKESIDSAEETGETEKQMRFKQTVSQKKRQKHIPLRRCVVCRKTAAKSELLRFYRDDKGDWQLDLKQQQGSRGMWLCNNSHECYDIKRLKNFFGKDTKRIVEEIKLINKIQELKTPVKGG